MSEKISFGTRLSTAWDTLRGTLKLTDVQKWRDAGFLGETTSGVSVTASNGVRLVAHYACIQLVARVMATLPLKVYQKMPDGSRRVASDHPVNTLLTVRPNNEMYAFNFRESLQVNLSNVGKAFADIVWDKKTGFPKELWPIAPENIEVFRDPATKEIQYRYLPTGEVLPAWKILHIPGMGFDGINSFSPVGLFRNTFGLGLAAEEFGGKFFSQGMNVGAFLEHPSRLDDTAYKRLKSSMNEQYRGLGNSHSVIILEEGTKFQKLPVNMQDAQFLETRKFTTEDIARIHGVPPHLIGHLDKATFSNIEHQGINAVQYLFMPWAARWENALTVRLLTQSERDRGLYIEYNLDGLMRGDFKTRMEAWGLGMDKGLWSADEVRAKENEPPQAGGVGKSYYIQAAMVPKDLAMNGAHLKSKEPAQKECTDGN